jgi:hypothetical protein
LVPLALEYYLGVIEFDGDDESVPSDSSDEGKDKPKKGDDDGSDEDGTKKKKKSKKGAKDVPLGPDGKP